MSIQERIQQLNREQAEHAAAHAYAVRCFEDRLRVIQDSCGHEVLEDLIDEPGWFGGAPWRCVACGREFWKKPTRKEA